MGIDLRELALVEQTGGLFDIAKAIRLAFGDRSEWLPSRMENGNVRYCTMGYWFGVYRLGEEPSGCNVIAMSMEKPRHVLVSVKIDKEVPHG